MPDVQYRLDLAGLFQTRFDEIKSLSMRELHFKVIQHSEQRYNTIGDYFTNGAVEEFRVLRPGQQRSELAVFIHELVERPLE